MSEKVGAKFPATIHGYSMVKFACINDAFLDVFFKCKQAQQKVSKKKRKGEKGTANKKNSKIKKPKDVGHFLVQKSQNFDFRACPSQNVVKRDASGKKDKLLCCKCLFDQIKANLAELIQPVFKFRSY